MISFDEAVATVIRVARPIGIEDVPIGDGHGRVLAAPVVAQVDSPPCDVSAMDGYALASADLGTLPARLAVVGEAFAGSEPAESLGRGQCLRIFTGGPIPAGADRVVIQEVVRREGAQAIIDADPGPARHVRTRASDFAVGALLVERGTRLNFRALVAAAGGDVASLSVWRRPRLVVLGTGDELAAPGTAAGIPGSIPESVSLGVAALAEDWGGTVIARQRLGDQLGQLEQAAGRALDDADLIVVTGGASVGEKDFAKAMFEGHGLELLFAKVAIKPGKPVWLGRARGKLVLGLPGNPTSALVTARLLLAPLVAGLAGGDPREALKWRQLPLLSALPACGARETFVRGRAGDAGVSPVQNQDSGAQLALVESDLLIRRRPGATAAAPGEPVELLSF